MRDVVVVGAGPAGLHAAYRLAAAGIDVVLLEARAQIGEGAICSGVIGEEAFARFDLPSDSLLTKIRCIQAISPQGRTLEHRTYVPLAGVVDKGGFNRALGRRARAVGVEICTGRFVESLEPTRSSVVLRFRSRHESSGTLMARVAVIASGLNCSLNRVLGLAQPRQVLKAIQGDVMLPTGDPSAPTRVYVGQSVAPGAFGWAIPLGNGKSRLGVMTEHSPKPYFKALLRRVAPTLDECQVDTCQKGIAQAPVGRCVADRILAIGEAAGHVKTSTGGGIYYGLLSADFAAEVILRAFQKGDFTSNVLADFERYWRTKFGNELLVGYFARNLAARFPDSVIEKVFEEASASNLLARLNGRLKFDWHYRALLETLRSLLA